MSNKKIIFLFVILELGSIATTYTMDEDPHKPTLTSKAKQTLSDIATHIELAEHRAKKFIKRFIPTKKIKPVENTEQLQLTTHTDQPTSIEKASPKKSLWKRTIENMRALKDEMKYKFTIPDAQNFKEWRNVAKNNYQRAVDYAFKQYQDKKINISELHNSLQRAKQIYKYERNNIENDIRQEVHQALNPTAVTPEPSELSIRHQDDFPF